MPSSTVDLQALFSGSSLKIKIIVITVVIRMHIQLNPIANAGIIVSFVLFAIPRSEHFFFVATNNLNI